MNIEDVVAGQEYGVRDDTTVRKRRAITITSTEVVFPNPYVGGRLDNVAPERVLRPWKEHTAMKRLLPGAEAMLRAIFAAAGIDASISRYTTGVQLQVMLEPDQVDKLANLLLASDNTDSALASLLGSFPR